MLRPMTFVTLVGLQFATPFGYQAAAAEPSFTDFPFMVHCEHSGIDRAFYLSKIVSNGVAIYISPDRQAGTVTIQGQLNRSEATHREVAQEGRSGNCGLPVRRSTYASVRDVSEAQTGPEAEKSRSPRLI